MPSVVIGLVAVVFGIGRADVGPYIVSPDEAKISCPTARAPHASIRCSDGRKLPVTSPRNGCSFSAGTLPSIK